MHNTHRIDHVAVLGQILDPRSIWVAGVLTRKVGATSFHVLVAVTSVCIGPRNQRSKLNWPC
jgi:hypothetical protein